MKILVVSQYFYPETFRINDICKELVSRGHTVDVLTSLPNVPQGKFYEGYSRKNHGETEWNGVGIERVNVIERTRGSGLKMILNCASFAVNSYFAAGKYGKKDYDVIFVFCNSPVTQIVPAARVKRMAKIPLCVWILDIWPESMFFLLGMKEKDIKSEGLFRKISRWYSNHLYKKADILFTSSLGFESKLRPQGLTKQKFSYFPNYAEEIPPVEPADRSLFGFSDDDFIVGFGGNIGLAQGLDLTVAATEDVNDRRLKWLIMGDGPEAGNLKAEIKRRGLEDRYCFTGFVDQRTMQSNLEMCEAVLVPLKDHEILRLTVPAKLQSAMKAARPVIAFMNGAGADVVNECGCGVSAKAEDPEKLAEAIARLMGMPKETREKMGKSGLEYCNRHYNRETLIDQLESELAEAVRSKQKQE